MAEKYFENDEMYKFGDKYKFKALKVYSSTEWMANSTKKYRKVFDKNEVDYIRAEFSFYNKFFDEKDWESVITLKAFELKGSKRKEICNQEEKLVVEKTQNVVFTHKGWGTDKIGGFWKKGKYVWEAYIDEKLVGTQEFYIEDIGIVTEKDNPYFEVESIKLFAGPYDGWAVKNRKYLRKFDREATQYLWVEVKIRNKLATDWNCELFINHYDHAGQFKARISSFRYIEKNRKGFIYTFDEGWGSKEGGTWRDDKYTVEIIFMDTLIAIIPFEVGDEEIEGIIEPVVSNEYIPQMDQNEQNNLDKPEEAETLEDVLDELDGLIGLQEIKKKIRDHISYLDFIRLRKEKGFEDSEEIKLHSVFTGNPGTGKTTVVKLLGKIYNKMGLLSEGHVHEVDRVDLVGEFIGQTAPKVKEAIDEARGGVLFIDEAYMLARKDGDSKDFGKEVIEVLVKEMSDGEGDLAIMFAGYPEEMETLLNSNPGLRSRLKYYFHFDDYYPDELVEIAQYACEKRCLKLDEQAKEYIEKIIVEAYRNRDKTFGNARYAFSLIDEGKMNLGLRIMQQPDVEQLTKDTLSTVTLEDVEKISLGKKKRKLDIKIDEDLLRHSMQELNSLIGLNNIKNDINEMVKLVRYYRETGKDVLNSFSLHTVFIGNPGTGKTTVSRIIGKIAKALGLLERGHIVECDREGLIAGYIGQTAIKTKERIDEAKGGILFIDEAYALAEGSHNSYGNEAIEVLLKNMEDKRGEFAIIVAGYPEPMERFLKSNPGLKSRFDRTFQFNDFSPEELLKIAVLMFVRENLTPDKKAEEYLKELFANMVRKKDRYFGNARTIRRIVEEATKNQNLRMAFTPSEKRTPKMLGTLSYEDVKEVVVEEFQRTTHVGFKR